MWIVEIRYTNGKHLFRLMQPKTYHALMIHNNPFTVIWSGYCADKEQAESIWKKLVENRLALDILKIERDNLAEEINYFDD